jgi:hypothetical protein
VAGVTRELEVQSDCPFKHSADFDECSIYDEADLWEKLPKLLLELKEELGKASPVLCYAG